MTRVADGLFVDVNAAWEAMTGYRHDEVVGRLVKHFRIWPAAEDRASVLCQKSCNMAELGNDRRRIRRMVRQVRRSRGQPVK